MRRPTLEVTSWLAPGGGVRVIAGTAEPVFDLRLGGNFTLAVGRKENLRLGPFIETATTNFDSVQILGGVELFVGAAPRPLRMFYYSGEGVFSARLGAGWTWRDTTVTPAQSAPITSVTLSYGYRAPFSLRQPEEQSSPVPDARDTLRYMVIARLWANASVDLPEATAWQLTAGIEFEPVGAFRYLFGLY